MHVSLRDAVLIGLLAAVGWGLSTTLRDQSCPPEWSYGSDSTTYTDLGSNLAEHHRYVLSPSFGYAAIGIPGPAPGPTPSYYVVPGYPAMLALGYALHLPKEKVPYLVAFLSYVLLLYSCFYFWKLLFADWKASWFWGTFVMCVAFNPTFIIQLQAIGRDLFSTACTSLFVTLLTMICLRNEGSPLLAAALALATTLTLSVRSNMVALVGPVLAATAFLAWRQNKRWILNAAVLALTSMVVTLGLWVGYQKHLTGRWILGADSGAALYSNYVYFNQSMEAVRQDRAIFERHFYELLGQGVPAGKAVTIINSETCAFVRDFLARNHRLALRTAIINFGKIFFDKDYFWFPRLIYVKLANTPMATVYEAFKPLLYVSPLWARLSYRVISFFFYLLYVLVPMFGMLFFLAERPPVLDIDQRRTILLILALSAVLFLVATGLFNAQARYRMPILEIAFPCALIYLCRLRQQ